MNNKNFTVTIEVLKTPQEVFNCITNDVSKWWGGKDFEGSSKKLNDEFIIHHPGAHYSKQQVIELIPNEKLVWLVTASTLHWLKNDPHEWANTKMIFEITTKDSKTFLNFTHEGLIPELECYVLCKQGWTMVVTDWLYNYVMYNTPHFIL